MKYKFGNYKNPMLPLFRKFSFLKERKQRIKIKIDPWDTYSADYTIGCMVYPLLKQFRKDCIGIARIDQEDVPESIRIPQEEYDRLNGFLLIYWQWILDEMIWTFEQVVNRDWEEQYGSGEIDIKTENGQVEYGPNHTWKVDQEGLQAHINRMQNGFKLFGKYYTNLWN